jgi:PAS domain S-box-containing protein
MVNSKNGNSEEFKNLELTHQALLDNIYDACVSLNSDGIVTLWNRKAELTFGWKANEVVGKLLSETIIPPPFRKAHEEGLKRFMATHQLHVMNQTLDLTAVHKNGNEFPIQIFIYPLKFGGDYQFYGIIHDVSEITDARKQARLRTEEFKIMQAVAQSLQETNNVEDMLREALGAIQSSKELHVENKAGIFLADDKKQTLRLVTTIGKFPTNFLENQREVPFYNTPYGRCFTSRELVVNNQCWFQPHRVGPFGDVAYYGSYIVPLISRQYVVGVLFLYTPESDSGFEGSQELLLSIGSMIANAVKHRQFEEKIQEQNVKLQELNKLKNTFLGTASHDLRNTLQKILSYAGMLVEEADDPLSGTDKDMIRKIKSSGEYMNTLLNNLLDISKIESGQIFLDKNLEDVNTLAKEQIEMNHLLANQKEIKLKFEEEVLPPLNVDKNCLIQVMDNFINNAVKFSPKQSNIDIKLRRVDDKALFSVTDEGPGISEKDQIMLFNEFQTVGSKPTAGEKTTGLGLSICKKIIRLHGGDVGVTSELGRGSTFYFKLPVDAAEGQSFDPV